MTQKEYIIKWLEEYGSITPLDALREFGIMRLAPRISELKEMGYNIITKIEISKNRYNKPIHYDRYELIKQN